MVTPRWFYVLCTASIAASAALVARGVSALAAAHLAPAPFVSDSVAPPSPSTSVAPPVHEKRTVVEAVPLATPKAPPDLTSLPRCADGRVVVRAVDPLVDARSLAVVETARGKSMVRLGDEVDGRRVIAIGAERVVLRDGARWCFVDGTKAGPEPGKVAAAAPTMAVAGPAAVKGIALVDDTHARIDRLLRDKLLENHLELGKTLRGIPDVVDGKIVGLKLASAPPGSVPAALGLRPGDSLRTINGLSLASPEQMLEAFGKLRTAPFLEIQYVRAGETRALRLDVV